MSNVEFAHEADPITQHKANREDLDTVLEISNVRAINCTNGSCHVSEEIGERFVTPLESGAMLIWAGQCHTCFSKFVPLRQLFDNHYTVGTEISTLYQTEHQTAAAT